MLKKVILSALILSNVACTTIEVVHSPVGCLGIPNHNVIFTDEEKASITEPVLTKFEIIATTYKERIKTQCEINKAHDNIHKG